MPGRGQPELDCMFFPCTADRSIHLFEDALRDAGDRSQQENRGAKYLDKPTIIMCNPNALIYQWMVTSANAYWLDFFLRRDCNVLVWNYRGYGQS